VLGAAAVLKLSSPERSRLALATFGLRGRAAWVAWVGMIATEVGLAAGVIAGSRAAALAAAAMMIVLAAAIGGALLRGRAGEDCGCFGAGSTVGPAGLLRNLGLAVAFTAAALLPYKAPSQEGWLALGLGVALVCCGGLGVAVLALAREIGILRLRVGPDSALEIPGEGPELGGRVAPLHRLAPGARAELLMAVFTSRTCRICAALQPAVASLTREAAFAVEVFDEEEDAAAWEAWDVPGSPYAVVTDPGGLVLAKGTFNNLAQLESVLATAQRRRGAISAEAAVV
jgi:hypothetical protein